MTVEPATHTATAAVQPRFSGLRTIASLLIAALILVAGGIWGARVHRATWDLTEPIRFVGDITNAFNQGRRSAEVGLSRTYDEVAISARTRPDGVRDYGLDYPPLRLAAAHYWYQWTRERFPDVIQWQNTRQFHEPLLILNESLLGLAALSVFGLVHMGRRWRAENRLAGVPPAGTGVVPAAMAALLAWLSLPAMLVGFGWPQWDIAVPAFFLAALYLGSRNAWTFAGVMLATGAMYKGQVLAGLPVFIIWPLAAGRWLALPRFAIGFLLAAGIIAAPFALRTGQELVRPEVIWFSLAMLLPWLLALAARTWRSPRPAWWIVPVILVVAICGMAGLVAAWYIGAAVGVVLSLIIFFIARRVSWRYQFTLPSLGVASAIWVSLIASGASWNWLRVGLLYGTEHFQAFIMGAPSNFAALLPQFRIARPDVVAFTAPQWLWGASGVEVTWAALLRGIYVVGSVLCAIAAGIHFRRRNPLFLLAAITPWLLFVTFPAQIHERYILYPALASAVLVALGFGWSFMHIGISLIATLPVLHGMLKGGQHAKFLAEQMEPGFGTQLLRNVQATHPGIGWALVTIALVCLWKSLDIRRPAPAPQSKPATASPDRA